MMLHVSAQTGRAGPAGEAVLRKVREIAAAQAALPRPDRAGRSIGLP
jgi:carnitine 3-dehydrogenase